MIQAAVAGPGALPAAQAGRRLRPTGDFLLGRRQRPEGGEIGWRKAAQLPQPFDSMIGSLAVGDVTEPVRTPGGFIILKLEEKRGGSKMVRDEVHVRHILLKPSEIRSEAETEKLAQKLYERIQSGEDFGELAKSSPKIRAPPSTAATRTDRPGSPGARVPAR
ncbi:peptidylprolyl isomerase [Pseudomonas aeruginosa]|nr:peptidylprolyl isomerase [Pseudomonas aeruginosa]